MTYRPGFIPPRPSELPEEHVRPDFPMLGPPGLSTLELVDTPIWVLDPAAVRMVWANPAGLAFWGAPSLDALAARDLASSISAAARARLAALAETALGRGEVVRERRTFFPGGVARPVEVVTRGVCLETRSDPMLLIEVHPLEPADDATAQRAVDVLSAIAMGAMVFDEEGRPIWENHAARCTFSDPAGGRPTLDGRVVGPAARETLRTVFERADPVTMEVELATSRGPRWHWVDVRTMTDGPTGRRVGLMVDCDIHRWKMAELDLREAKEAAERANRTKTEFLANMSHEIRTPMNGVLGSLEVLERTDLDPFQRRWLGTIRSSARALLAILNDILDLSRIEAGKVRLDPVPFDLRETIEDVALLHHEAAARKGVGLDLALGRELRTQVEGDPVRLAQVLGNLISNAVKFTERGSVAVRARATEVDPVALVVRFEVEDTGPGIAPEAQRRIFSAFEQADGSVTRRHGGTGLGLTISRRLVALMGGALELESEVGRGSTFAFTLRYPLAATDDHPRGAEAGAPSSDVAEAAPPSGDAGESIPSPRVLLVEDNPVNREVALAMLEAIGCEVEWAEHGRAALAAVESTRFDLILMDCQMPNMDGYTATRTLRDREGAEARTPVIALTANAMAGDQERCLDAGMDDFLAKPFELDALEAKVRAWAPSDQSETGFSAD